MSEFANFVEYCIEKKVEGTYRLKRILLVMGAVVLPVIVLLLCVFITNLHGLIPAFAVIVTLFIIGYWYFSRFTHIEYEYRILQGEFQMDIIYGQRQRKRLLDVRIRDMTVIRPYEESRHDEVYGCDKVTNYAISVKHPTPDLYYFIHKDESGRSEAVFFEATRKTLEIMKFYNHAVLTIKEDLRH